MIKYDGLEAKLSAISEEARDCAKRLFAPFYEGFKGEMAPLAWLTDLEINNYFSHLAKTSTSKIRYILSVDFQSPSFFSSMKSRLQRKAQKKLLQEARVILLPYVEECHWYLLIIEKADPEVFHITTMDGKNNSKFHPKLWQKAEQLIELLHPEGIKVDRVISKQSLKIPPQLNAYDCGAVICFLAKELCESGKLKGPSDARAYTLFREEIATVLASMDKESLHLYGKASPSF